jgi:hypothetical protein
LNLIGAANLLQDNWIRQLSLIVVEPVSGFLGNASVFPELVRRFAFLINEWLDSIAKCHGFHLSKSPPLTIGTEIVSLFRAYTLKVVISLFQVRAVMLKPTVGASAAKGSNLLSTGYPQFSCYAQNTDIPIMLDTAIEHQLACAQKQNRIESPSTSDRCETCGEAIGESLSYTQCQDCWEASCSESWWEMVRAIGGAA